VITVGGREVLFNKTLFIPLNEKAEIAIEIETDDILTIVVVFEEDKIEEGKKNNASFNIAGEDNKGIFTFKNWNSTFGSSIKEPVFFADDNNGKPISFLGNAVKLGEVYKVEIQIMRGGKSG